MLQGGLKTRSNGEYAAVGRVRERIDIIFHYQAE